MDREKGSRRLVFVCVIFIMSFIASHVYAADMTIGNTIVTIGDWTVTGTMNATSLTGDGSGLTNLNGGNITTGTISGVALAPGSVGVAALGANAVTPANISFFSNVAIVAPSGGDYNNPATAMSNYSVWCGTPSSTNPCLLKIMPGVYNVGSSPVVMQPYIDIEGSGEKTTTITGAISSSSYPPTTGTVTGASNAEIRFLTVANTGAGATTVAILNSSASPSMVHVTATASGGTNNYGVYNSSSSPTMTNVTATASGGWPYNIGVYNLSSSPTMTNVTATASGGTYNYGVYNEIGSGTVKINHSVISGSTNTIYNRSGVTTYVGNTQLAGGAVSNSGTMTCAGVYDGSYTFYASTCP